MHEGGDILNELQLSVLLMRPYFIVRFYSWRVVGSMLGAGGLVKVFPRVAVHVRQRAFIHDCFRHFSFFPNFFFFTWMTPLCTVFPPSTEKWGGRKVA